MTIIDNRCLFTCHSHSLNTGVRKKSISTFFYFNKRQCAYVNSCFFFSQGQTDNIMQSLNRFADMWMMIPVKQGHWAIWIVKDSSTQGCLLHFQLLRALLLSLVISVIPEHWELYFSTCISLKGKNVLDFNSTTSVTNTVCSYCVCVHFKISSSIQLNSFQICLYSSVHNNSYIILCLIL